MLLNISFETFGDADPVKECISLKMNQFLGQNSVNLCYSHVNALEKAKLGVKPVGERVVGFIAH
jgi:hypothetical protein